LKQTVFTVRNQKYSPPYLQLGPLSETPEETSNLGILGGACNKEGRCLKETNVDNFDKV
jgi:hypothetical protein